MNSEKVKKTEEAIGRLEGLVKKLFTFKSETLKEQKFLDATLEGGEKIRIEGEAIEPGAKVFVVTEEGEVEAPNGSLIIKHEDGSLQEIVIEGGLIIDVKDPQTAEAPAEVEQKAEEEIKEDFNAKEKFEEVNGVVQTLLNSIDELKKEISSLKSENVQLKKVGKESFEILKALSEVPASKPTQTSLKAVQTGKPDKLDKFRDMAKQFNLI